MPAPKSREYHAVLDLLDRGQHDVAAARMYATSPRISEQEFRLLLNAFMRRQTSVRTA